MLQVADVSFAYRDAPVLRDVTFEIRPGELVGVLGPNGSGKTTLLRLLAGILRPTRGQVTLDGKSLSSVSRSLLARRVAVVPQETQLTFDYTVLEIALMGRYPHLGAFELEGPDDVAIAREALSSTGTDHLASRAFDTLSGGEKQRVIIASALAQFGRRDEGSASSFPPELLLLDEPTASLDPAYQLEVGTLLETLNRRRGLAVLLCTHDLNLAARLCRRLVMLRAGRILAVGDADRLLTPEMIRAVYDVDVEIARSEATGRPVLVPIRPTKKTGP